jgi:hypothetical protein
VWHSSAWALSIFDCEQVHFSLTFEQVSILLEVRLFDDRTIDLFSTLKAFEVQGLDNPYRVTFKLYKLKLYQA